MLGLPSSVRIYYAVEPVDMRKYAELLVMRSWDGLPVLAALRVDPDEALFVRVARTFHADPTFGDRGRPENIDRERAECHDCRFAARHELRFRDCLAVPGCCDKVISENFAERPTVILRIRIVPGAIQFPDRCFHAGADDDGDDAGAGAVELPSEVIDEWGKTWVQRRPATFQLALPVTSSDSTPSSSDAGALDAAADSDSESDDAGE